MTSRSTEGFKMFHSDHSFLSAKYFLWKYKNWLTVHTQHPFFSRILLLLRPIMYSWTAKAQKHIGRVLLMWWKRSYARLTFANWTFSCLQLVTKLRPSIDMFKKTWGSAALLVYVNLAVYCFYNAKILRPWSMFWKKLLNQLMTRM